MVQELSKYLTIALQGQGFGIPVLKIKEIIEYDTITTVPMLPRFIRGAINLRGNGVPVLDLAMRLGLAETEIGNRTCIVIVETVGAHGHGFDVGLLVDAVTEVVDIAPDAVEPAPSFDGSIDTVFLIGMGKVDDGFVVLLDVDRVLSMDDRKLLEQAGRQGKTGEAA